MLCPLELKPRVVIRCLVALIGNDGNAECFILGAELLVNGAEGRLRGTLHGPGRKSVGTPAEDLASNRKYETEIIVPLSLKKYSKNGKDLGP